MRVVVLTVLSVLKGKGLLLLLFLTAILWLDASWIARSTLPSQLDSTGFIWNSVDLYRYFSEPGEGLLQKISHPFDNRYPHWEYYVTMAFYRFLGVSEKASAFSLLPWCLVFMLSMYGCGRALCGERGGWLLLLGAAASPAFTLLAKCYFQEIPITAVTALGLYALLSSNFFEKRWPSLLFGLCLGAVMMFKGTGLLFLAAPLPAVFFMHVVRDARPWPWRLLIVGAAALSPLLAKMIVASPQFLGLTQLQGSRYLQLCLVFDAAMAAGALSCVLAPRLLRNDALSRAWNLLGSLLLALAVFFPWYAVNFRTVGGKLDEHVTFMPKDLLPFFYNLVDLEDFLYLAKLMMLVGLVVFLCRRSTVVKYAPFVSGAALAFTALSLTHPHFTKYTLPLLPFVLILGLLWLLEAGEIRALRPLRLAVVPLCLVLIVQLLGGYALASFPGAQGRLLRTMPLYRGDPPEPWGRYALQGLAVPTSPTPMEEPFHIDDCLERIRSLSPADTRPRVLMAIEFAGPFFLDRQNFMLEARLRGMSVEFLDGLDPAAAIDEKSIDLCVVTTPAGRAPPASVARLPLETVESWTLPWGNAMVLSRLRK